MRIKVKGFSLIELMIVIAIIGILAAIAVPAYRNYIYKARFSELTTFASNQAHLVSEYLATTGVSTTGSTAGSTICTNMNNRASTVGTANISSWAVGADCVVSVTGVAAQFANTPPTVKFTPTIQSDGSITWACTSAGSPYAPSNCP